MANGKILLSWFFLGRRSKTSCLLRLLSAILLSLFLFYQWRVTFRLFSSQYHPLEPITPKPNVPTTAGVKASLKVVSVSRSQSVTKSERRIPEECHWTRAPKIRISPTVLGRPLYFNATEAEDMLHFPKTCLYKQLYRRPRAAFVTSQALAVKSGVDKKGAFWNPNRKKGRKAGESSEKPANLLTDRMAYSYTTSSKSEDCPFFLTAVLLVRLYRTDKARLWRQELNTWLDYLRFAGVQHVLLYDAYFEKDEAVEEHTKDYRNEGFLTYIDWSSRAKPYGIAKTQQSAYQHSMDFFGAESTWHVAIDIDEYPYSTIDKEPFFMRRFLKRQTLITNHYKRIQKVTGYSDLIEISMANFLFLGAPDPPEEPHLFGRYWHRHPHPSNDLVKPIYNPDPNSLQANIHRNRILSGFRRMAAKSEELRMNHYWGARLQNWGPDTPEIRRSTIYDDGQFPILEQFRICDEFLRSGSCTFGRNHSTSHCAITGVLATPTLPSIVRGK